VTKIVGQASGRGEDKNDWTYVGWKLDEKMLKV
jgi:hypothetical protein